MTAEFVRTSSHADSPPFALIEQKGLGSRLAQELAGAFADMARDPRGFMKDLFSVDTRDSKRRQRIYAGLALAVVAHAVLLVLIAVVGWRTVFVKRVEEANRDHVGTWISTPAKSELKQPDTRGEDKGGGGGGQRSHLPASVGRPPQMLPIPQIASMNPSSIPEPSLPFPATIVGPESPPTPPAPIGDPKGKSGEFSSGPGTKGGIGSGEGPGVGDGKDSGTGPGSRGGKGGGPAGSREGSETTAPNAIDFNRIASLPGYRSWSWIHRPRPIITPEAAADKVIGIVFLRATFNADGTITDIELVMRVESMDDSAIESLRRSTFRPATNNGVPVTVRKVPIKVFVHY